MQLLQGALWRCVDPVPVGSGAKQNGTVSLRDYEILHKGRGGDAGYLGKACILP